ncbi:hypothetical protein LSUE1_G006097 [Lachnellula suecica]|uniref:Non-homologous end-joining factor 1 n=1 Tax=Lachnellula suecica TaxID=602035 RepID=A0A8T9C6F1_9HELO|nr:hypothetical protein LSUE1_G006097 [Lachnellula suecica]
MAWTRLRLSAGAAAQLPPLLLSAVLNSEGYTIRITDLTSIWSESLDRTGIIQRSQEEATSIDPGDDDQFRILLDKIRLGLVGGKGTTSALTITADDGRPALVLNITVPLPGGLAALNWPIKLSLAPQSMIASHFTIPLLATQRTTIQEVKALVEVLEAKDHIIQKLLDKLESQGTELGHIFPQLAGKPGRKVDRQMAEDRVQNLKKFDFGTWRQGLAAKGSSDTEKLLSDLFAGDTAGGLDLEPGTTPDEAAESWWESIKGITVNLNTGRITTNGPGKSKAPTIRSPTKPAIQKDPSVEENDDFQVQATPPRLASRAPKPSPPKPALDESTDSNDDDDLGGPSQASRIPDSFPKSHSQSQHRPPPSPSPPPAASPRQPKKLGKIGAKKAAPQPSPPHVTDDASTEDSLPPSPQKAPSPIPDPAPAPALKPKGKLGKIGGKKAPPPPAEPEPEPAPASQPTPKPKSKLGKIGGKKKTTAPADPDPDPISPSSKYKIKSSPHPTQEEVTAEEEVDRGRGVILEREASPEVRETSLERADRKREALKRELEAKAAMPKKKKRKF